EINALGAGRDGILVADRFGVLTTGAWVVRDGKTVAELAPRAKRATFRTSERAFHGTKIRFSELSSEPESAESEKYMAACERGLDRVVEKLSLETPAVVNVY